MSARTTQWRSSITRIGILLLLGMLTGCNQDGGDMSAGERVLLNLSDIEQEVLADKVVTLAELEKAAAIYAECVEPHVLEIEPWVPGQPISSSSTTITSNEKDEDAARVERDQLSREVERCYEEVDAIDAVWILQQYGDEPDDQAEQNFINCVYELGLTKPNASFEESSIAYSAAAQQEFQSGDVSPDSPIQRCGAAFTSDAGITALPGLADALAALDTGN